MDVRARSEALGQNSITVAVAVFVVSALDGVADAFGPGIVVAAAVADVLLLPPSPVEVVITPMVPRRVVGGGCGGGEEDMADSAVADSKVEVELDAEEEGVGLAGRTMAVRGSVSVSDSSSSSCSRCSSGWVASSAKGRLRRPRRRSLWDMVDGVCR